MFSPNKIGEVELKNRWIMLAIHTGFAEGNAFGLREFAFYEERAKNNVGAITIVLGVNAEGSSKGTHHTQELRAESLKQLADLLHEYDCKLIVQLFHCGRNESEAKHGDKRLLAPSAVPSKIYKTVPEEMTGEDITRTKKDFAQAALFCKDAGVDVVEVSASAGYLLSEFLSPVTNLRTDAYGYGNQKGQKFPIEVLEEIRKAVGDYPIIMKVSAAQMVEDGYELMDTVTFCQNSYEKMQLQGITVTGGWHESPVEQISYHVPKGGYAPLAGLIKKIVPVPVIACNRIQDKETAKRLLDDGLCDFVGSARAFLCDSTFLTKMEEDKPFLPCQGCNYCITRVLKGDDVACAFSPEAGLEYKENQRRKIATRKEVLVIGGGPAGMEAAKKAAERGFKTTIVTREKQLGGQLVLAALPPKKQGLQAYIDYMQATLLELGVTIEYDKNVDAAYALEKHAYFTVIATGSTPQAPPIAGVEFGHFAQDVLADNTPLPPQTAEGKIVVIGGGMIGLETAAVLKERCPDRNVVVVEAGKKMGQGLGALARPLLNELKKAGVSLMVDTEVHGLEKDKVLIQIGGQKFFLQADYIVLATGAKSVLDGEITTGLLNESLSYAIVGDADLMGDGKDAIGSAYNLFTRVYLA